MKFGNVNRCCVGTDNDRSARLDRRTMSRYLPRAGGSDSLSTTESCGDPDPCDTICREDDAWLGADICLAHTYVQPPNRCYGLERLHWAKVPTLTVRHGHVIITVLLTPGPGHLQARRTVSHVTAS
jgi:hypothetical protein